MRISRRIELKISGTTLLLRPPEFADAPAICEAVLASAEDLARWMSWCGPEYSIEDTEEWVGGLPDEWARDLSYQFSVFDAESGECLGGCGLNQINREYDLANLGYWVRTDRTGEGIATQSTVRVAQFGFQQVGLRRVEIVVAVENWASRRVAQNAGAHFEGILRNRVRLAGDNVDAAMHSLIPEDLQGGDG